MGVARDARQRSVRTFAVGDIMQCTSALPDLGVASTRVASPGDETEPPAEPIMVILILIAVVTAVTFSLLSTIGSALP